MRVVFTSLILVHMAPWSLSAQNPEVALEQAECIPVDGSGLLAAKVANEPPGASLRFHFRRLNAQVEDFYYVVGRPTGVGVYEAVLPRAADSQLVTPGDQEHWASWWQTDRGPTESGERAQVGKLETRDWLDALDQADLQTWLVELENEPVEYFATMVDAVGDEVAWSDRMLIVEVRRDCSVSLDDWQRGVADNLVLGQTADWQADEEPFHWQCKGIVTRIDPDGVPVADRRCRDTYLSLFADLEEEEDSAGRTIVEGPSRTQPYRTVKVFYGTDRRRLFTGNSWTNNLKDDDDAAYGGERGGANQLELGTCEVSIPLDHEPGELTSGDDPAQAVLLLSATRQDQALFLSDLRSELSSASDSAALVFIHGYNVSFEDAARRSAQITYDLHFRGVPLMYSWPSRGEALGYTIDEANIRWTVPNLERFLELVARESGAQEVHVIAHSMGNRAFTEVLRRFASRRGPDAPRFNQIVLVAPDVDAAVFHQEIAPAIACGDRPCNGDRVTLYASKKDKALAASKKLHGHPRAGDLSEGHFTTPGLDTIDASDADTRRFGFLRLGHSYHADKLPVILDLKATLAGKAPGDAARASRLRPEPSSLAPSYWVIDPER